MLRILYCVIFMITTYWAWHHSPFHYTNELRKTVFLTVTSWWQVRQPFLPPSQRHGYFLHITDMHIDEGYLAGASVDSDCHRFPSSAETLRQVKKAGMLGSPGEHCDSPIELAQRTLDWIKREWRDKIDFVVWTGDNARHDWDKKRARKRRHIYDLNQRVQDMMIDTFSPTKEDPRHIPLVPTFGNNDVYPHDTMGSDELDSDLLNYFTRLWRPWIPVHQRSTFQHGGYFAVDVGHRLRILSLNTLYFYAKNNAVKNCRKKGTPGHEQMTWFERELAKARSDNIKVYVMGHVPPSPRDYKNTCFQEYVRLASDYHDVIVGHFYGHLNMDHFLVFDQRTADTISLQEYNSTMDDHDFCINRNIEEYVEWLHGMYESIEPPDDQSSSNPPPQSPMVVIQVAPSVLPVYLPAIRIYQYEINDSDHLPSDNLPTKPHGTLLGYHQYFANITHWEIEAQEKGVDIPLEYQLEYSTKDAYDLDDLTADSYVQLALDMVDDSSKNRHKWSTYVKNMFVQTVQSDFSLSSNI